MHPKTIHFQRHFKITFNQNLLTFITLQRKTWKRCRNAVPMRLYLWTQLCHDTLQ